MKPTNRADWLLESEDFDDILEDVESPCTDPAVHDLVMRYLEVLPSTLWEANCWLDGALELAGDGTVYETAIMFIRDRLSDTGPILYVIDSQENCL